MIRAFVMIAALVCAQTNDGAQHVEPANPPAPSTASISLRADDCGDPTLVSQGYTSIRGRVVRVKGPTELVVVLDDGGRRRVRLAGTSTASLGRAARRRTTDELRRVAEAKRIDILTSVSADEASSFRARVFTDETGDLSLFLLERGLVRHKTVGYEIDWWVSCHYDRAEAEAKRGGRGIWLELRDSGKVRHGQAAHDDQPVPELRVTPSPGRDRARSR
jgi:hypothetical protein